MFRLLLLKAFTTTRKGELHRHLDQAVIKRFVCQIELESGLVKNRIYPISFEMLKENSPLSFFALSSSHAVAAVIAQEVAHKQANDSFFCADQLIRS